VRDLVCEQGSQIRMKTNATKIFWDGARVTGVEILHDGKTETLHGAHFISSMPIRELLQKFEPPAPPQVLEAANRLKYRDFLTVALIINRDEMFEDNWIYIHDTTVKMGRIQNFKNWSPEMVADPKKTCLGLEYFCFEGDGLWSMSDEELVELGRRELVTLGLAQAHEIEDGAVVRQPKAYPVYDGDYEAALKAVRAFLKDVPNLQLVGRNGMHRYNNQDHSMLTAILAAKNILGANFDLWAVNDDQEYGEEVSEKDKAQLKDFQRINETQPHVPSNVAVAVPAAISRDSH
jgi:protoporphyrinogen oxidase